MEFSALINGCGCHCHMQIIADREDGEILGTCDIGKDSGIVSCITRCITGRHAIFFKVTTDYSGWTGDYFTNRPLFELKSFVFLKQNSFMA